jgi:hypothetical protein
MQFSFFLTVMRCQIRNVALGSVYRAFEILVLISVGPRSSNNFHESLKKYLGSGDGKELYHR